MRARTHKHINFSISLYMFFSLSPLYSAPPPHHPTLFLFLVLAVPSQLSHCHSLALSPLFSALAFSSPPASLSFCLSPSRSPPSPSRPHSLPFLALILHLCLALFPAPLRLGGLASPSVPLSLRPSLPLFLPPSLPLITIMICLLPRGYLRNSRAVKAYH